MQKVKVKLTISRSGPKVNQARGDEVEVGLLEAGRLVKTGACEPLDAKTLKAIAEAEAAAAKETASASDPAPETANAPAKGEGKTDKGGE